MHDGCVRAMRTLEAHAMHCRCTLHRERDRRKITAQCALCGAPHSSFTCIACICDNALARCIFVRCFHVTFILAKRLRTFPWCVFFVFPWAHRSALIHDVPMVTLRCCRKISHFCFYSNCICFLKRCCKSWWLPPKNRPQNYLQGVPTNTWEPNSLCWR